MLLEQLNCNGSTFELIIKPYRIYPVSMVTAVLAQPIKNVRLSNGCHRIYPVLLLTVHTTMRLSTVAPISRAVANDDMDLDNCYQVALALSHAAQGRTTAAW